MKKGILILLCLMSVQAFAQWKSYYPEPKSSKKDIVPKEENNLMFSAHLFNALRAKALENYDEALKEFQKCIKLDDKNPLPFYESALINKGQANFDLAIEQIKTAVALEESNRWYLLAYAEILFGSQDFSNAAIQYKKLIAIEKGNEQFYYMLADTYIYANDFSKAIDVYDDLEKHKGVNKMISMQKHRLYMELSRKKDAIKELNSLLDAFPKDVEAMEILSELYLLNDEKEKAFELFKKIGALAPDNGRIHLTLADYYRESGDNKQSFEELKLAFKSSKLNVDTKVRILASYFQIMGLNNIMKEQAYELSEILIAAHKGNVTAHAIYADMLYADNRFDEAKEEYKQVLEKDKTKAQVWSQILFIQAEQNDFAGLLDVSAEALTYFPTDPLFYYFNGIANKWFKNYDEAMLSLESGIEFVIDNVPLRMEFYSSLADINHVLEKHEVSDSLYEKVLDIDPENIVVLNNYSYYLSVRKLNLERAKEMSLKCNELEPDNGTYQDTYAWILYELKEYEQAKEWMLKALINGGDKSAVVVEHYGDILYRLNDIEGAVVQWKKANQLGEASKFLSKKIAERKLYE